jgi:hypothetical protein
MTFVTATTTAMTYVMATTIAANSITATSKASSATQEDSFTSREDITKEDNFITIE